MQVKYDPGDDNHYKPKCYFFYKLKGSSKSVTIEFGPDEVFEDDRKVKCQKKHPRSKGLKLPVNIDVPNKYVTWRGEKVTDAKVKWGLKTWSDADSERLDVIILKKPSKNPVPTVAFLQQGDTYPAINGQTANLRSQGGVDPSNVVCGAIQSVLAHPTDPDICFAGSTNGGVWRTFSCTATEPDWEPLTDDQDSLSIGDMVFDVEDTTSNTVLAAVGTRSAFGRRGGPAIGMLYSENSLANSPSWQVLNNSAGLINFRDKKVKFKSAYVRGDLMLAAAYLADPFVCSSLGVFRSVDRGKTWTNVLSGVAHDIASDPNDPSRFYATLDFTGLCSNRALATNGVFTSDDFGETWTFTSTNGITPVPQGELSNAKLSVSADGSRVWSGLVRKGVVDSISYTNSNGASWTKMDTVLLPARGDPTGLNPREKPGGQGGIHFSLLASPTNRHEIYAGGDRQAGNTQGLFWPNFIGATDFTGILFRGDSRVSATNAVPSPQWEHMTNSDAIAAIPGGGTASNSGPHADSRDMEIRADGSILEGNDGGIVIRTKPESNEGDWFGVCGNMQAFETHSIAYEPVFGLVLYGNQDTGTIAGTLGVPNRFTTLYVADGNHCMIDYASDPDNLYFYFGNQRYLFMFRATLNKTSFEFTKVVNLRPKFGNRNGDFVSVGAMNPANQAIFAIATGQNLFPTDGISITGNRGEAFSLFSTGLRTSITAMAWSRDGTILYVASSSDITRCVLNLSRGTFRCLPTPVGSVGAVVSSLAVDWTNSDTLYAVTTSLYFPGSGTSIDSPAVFVSFDGGSTWADITIPGSLVDTAATGVAAVYLNKDSASTVVVGTSNGVLVPDGSRSWKVLAKGLPTVTVMDMVYEPVDDRLVVATLGRGTWFLENASKAVGPAVSGSQSESKWTQNPSQAISKATIDFDSLLSIMPEKTAPPLDDAPLVEEGEEILFPQV